MPRVNEACIWITGGVSIVFLITGIVLFSVSFDTLEPTSAGLLYDNNWVTLSESKVYNNGRYFVGLGRWFIKFPMGNQNIEYHENKIMKAWSKEGQSIQLDIDVSYRLDRSRIVQIYRRYGKDWDGPIEFLVAREIKQVASDYTAEEYFSSRNAIGAAMKAAVRAVLRSEYMYLEVFNLRRIYLPAQFEAKILKKVVQAQLRETAVNQAAIDRLRAQIEVIKGEGDAQIARILANANARATLTLEKAYSDGENKLRKAEADNYRALQGALGLNSTTLLQYKWAQIMSHVEEGLTHPTNLRFTVGFDQNGLKFGG